MEFREVVRRRRMVRNYADTPVDPAVVQRMLDHATRAPSAGFSQGWAFVVLDTPDDVRRFWTATADSVEEPDPWLAGMMRAPVVIVPCSSRTAYLERYSAPDKAGTRRRNGAPAGDPWNVPYWHMDAAMASLLILQTAVDEGLGACFFGLPPHRELDLREELWLPDDVDPVGAITVGHRAEDTGTRGSARTRRRRPTEEVVHRGRWGSQSGTGGGGHLTSPLT